jgi:hypothetical protein
VITTGEDASVRFWDTSFQLISEYFVAKLYNDGKLDPKKLNMSVQSIDIYACKPPATMVIDGSKSTGYEKDIVNPC